MTAAAMVVLTAWPAGGAVGQATTAPVAEASDAVTTRLLVRAVSHDAKVIGSNVGGARITVRDLATGRVLASGVQEGSTGSTRAIMEEPRPRGHTAYGADREAAGFLAEMELAEPTVVEVTAAGPLGTPHATQRASKTLLLVPGVDVLGEGLILTLHGFTVEILEAAAGADGGVDVRARVTMLCGCPTEPGGMWDAEAIHIIARALEDGRVVAEAPLAFAGVTSEYAGRLEAANGPVTTVRVVAVDAERANAGMAETAVEDASRGEPGGNDR